MNINQLEYFISVAENLSFTKAAQKCFISQTAMTQQIRALEAKVGVPLFIRDKHHVELTNAGKVFLTEARVIVAKNQEAVRLARLASEGVSGELTIGYISGYGGTGFPDLLKNFHTAFPGVKIKLIRNNMSVLFDKLDHGECDVIFTVAPFQTTGLVYKTMYIKSYPVMGVLYKGHPLDKSEHLTYQDLEGEKFIMMEPADRPKDQMEESMLIFERGGYLPNVVAVEGDPETLLVMIASGMGISILPEYIIRNYKNHDAFVILPMLKADMTAETLDFHVSWLSQNVNPVLEHFLEMAHEVSGIGTR